MSKTEDFSDYFLADTSAIDIDLPNGDPMLYPKVGGEQVRVNVYGPATKQYQQAEEARTREATKRVVQAMNTKGKKEAEDKDVDIKFLVAVTQSIDNFPYPGGPEAVYREPKLKYISEQVMRHVGDTSNFFGTAPTA